MQECNQASECKNSLVIAGFGSAMCGVCRFAPDNSEYKSLRTYWKPLEHGQKHPLAIAEKRQAADDRQVVLKERRKNKDQSKRQVLRKAARAEKVTERNLIHATKNSGRSNKDGDHVAAGEITLDTKLQTKRENPVVLLHELHKVGEDAKRAGNWMGALVLRNMNGVGVVAMTESDFARLLQRIA